MMYFPEPWMDIVCVISLTLILSLIAYRFELLTKDGTIAAAITGLIIGFCGSVAWLFLLVVFAALGFVATMAGISKKKEKGLQEGTHGERTAKNVLGVALPCLLFAIVNILTHDEYHYLMIIGYISTIAVAAADTAASEIGTKDRRVYLITTFKRVEPGVDGGISPLGTIVSLLASIVVTLIGWTAIFGFDYNIDIIWPMLAGFIGCMLDSLFGATFETKGYMNKYVNNCSTGIIGGIIAIVLTALM